jgi:hypothetical protein
MKKTTESATDTAALNPFEFGKATVAGGSRKLDYTPALIDLSNRRAQHLMISLAKEYPHLIDLSNTMLDSGNPQDCIDLLGSVYGHDVQLEDAEILNGCSSDQLARLLESRRSDRSKAKAKGLRIDAVACRTYIASMYAELLVRIKMDKPYAGSAQAPSLTDESDLAAIDGRIKSLQTKKSRLKKLVAYEESAREEYQAVELELARLNSLKPTGRVAAKTVVKDVQYDELRAGLKLVDTSKLDEKQLKAYEILMAKLG